jgi:thiol:disulfide interchange protein
MDHRKIMMIFLVGLAAVVCGALFISMNKGRRAQSQESQWKWDDSWNGNMPPNKSSKPNDNEKTEPSKLNEQIETLSYSDAISTARDLKKQILVIYTADWCAYCKRMKSETLSNKKVKDAMKNYVVVYVDTDKDRSGVGKFSITGLPSYVVTNSNEAKIKTASGFMDANAFLTWLTFDK